MWRQADSATWMQYVSKGAASRMDVLALQEALDQRLQQRQARASGICPVRDDLYKQCFGAWGGCRLRSACGTGGCTRGAERERDL
jgi:hypothetical protein